MLNLKQLEDSIMEQCIDPDGILSLVRANQFSDDKHDKLVKTLANYRQALADQEVMSRKMVGFLRAIDKAVLDAVIYNDREPISSETERKIGNFHQEMFDLLLAIFDLEE